MRIVSARSGMITAVVTAAVTFTICQASSHLVARGLALHETVAVSRLLHFTHIRNTGGVFGMFQGHPAIFGLVSLAIVAGAVAFMLRTTGWARYQCVCFGLIVGAALSNVADRLVYGAVIDFLDVQGIPYWDYVFNPADVAIHLGAWPLVLGTLLTKDKS
jgi:signal peptidase II